MQSLPRLPLPAKQTSLAERQPLAATYSSDAKRAMLVWHQLEPASWTPAAKVVRKNAGPNTPLCFAECLACPTDVLAMCC